MVQSRFNDDATAKAYQELLLPLIFEPWGKLLIHKAGPKPGDRILDVATGPGTLAFLAAGMLGPSSRIVGVDNSPPMLAQAKAQPAPGQGGELIFQEAPAEALPFPAAQFDVVFCQQGLQFFSDQPGALREMRRVLRPGGRLALAMWSDERAMTLFVAFHSAVEAALADPPKRAALGWLDPSGLSGLLGRAGFSEPAVAEETLTVALERGLPQALECAVGTTSGAAMRRMNEKERTFFEKKVAENLAPWTHGQAIHAPARALIAVASA